MHWSAITYQLFPKSNKHFTHLAQSSSVALAISSWLTCNLDVVILQVMSHQHPPRQKAIDNSLPLRPSLGSINPRLIIIRVQQLMIGFHHVSSFFDWDGRDEFIPAKCTSTRVIRVDFWKGSHHASGKRNDVPLW